MEALKDTYNIVVLGGMNPRIHHPAWYHMVKLFDASEFETALASPDTVVMPPLAKICLPHLTIWCQEDRWQVSTHDRSQLPRLGVLTAKLFDEILPHTPVSALGYNFGFHRETRVVVSRYLASCIAAMPLGLESDKTSWGEISLRRGDQARTLITVVKPVAQHEKTALIHHNFEYRFENEGQFNLGDTIASRYQPDLKEAEERTSRIVAAINASAGD